MFDFVTAWKASSVVLTGLFGVLGLLTEFKEKHTNKVTKWGYISLAGIVISSALGAAVQLKESQNDAAKAKTEAEKALRIAENTDNTLHEVHRLLTPLGQFSVEAIYEAPCDDAIYRHFCKSAGRQIMEYLADPSGPFPNEKTISGEFWAAWSVKAMASVRSKSANSSVVTDYVIVTLFKGRSIAEKYAQNVLATSRDPRSADLSFKVEGSNVGANQNLLVMPDLSKDTVEVHLRSKPEDLSNAGNMASIADVASATMVIEEYQSLEFQNLRLKLSGFKFHFSNGQSLVTKMPIKVISDHSNNRLYMLSLKNYEPEGM